MRKVSVAVVIPALNAATALRTFSHKSRRMSIGSAVAVPVERDADPVAIPVLSSDGVTEVAEAHTAIGYLTMRESVMDNVPTALYGFGYWPVPRLVMSLGGDE